MFTLRQAQGERVRVQCLVQQPFVLSLSKHDQLAYVAYDSQVLCQFIPEIWVGNGDQRFSAGA